ncbi:Galactose oxidase, central domain [Lishizhenia tianjinensis]|uniref:Galactose oxidase, central domain n=1 Tax=Lishizhenia tianjinensis TaxID=477690 RepID=A0A1I6YT20_9FLAO|nr:kelch repeat-containing protein [Lishizhenia tianjinensis]SFT53583.1 Galactose oxidase, central domain [Lishizhenia tianjinensis]
MLTFFVAGQNAWQVTELDTLPMATTNNALCEGFVNSERFVYSFGGLDTSKIYSGIHRKSFRYNVSQNHWTSIDDVPDTLGKIASAASYVHGKIYVLGGYHVLSNGTEISSNRVHIYNPVTESWESDGSPIPFPIDDHVQTVYKDSLIFVIGGWSNTNNVPHVQVYNVYTDSWTQATQIPNNSIFKSFGASGYMIGDTIFYAGGVSDGTNFLARKYMRKGVLQNGDPYNILWTQMDDLPGDPLYRAACSGYQNTVFWMGGSAKAYNYNGIAYDGSGGVDPNKRIVHYQSVDQDLIEINNASIALMDLRGIAKIGGGNWILAGGMDTSQVVSNKTYLLHNPNFSGILGGFQPPYFKVKQVGSRFEIQTEFAGTVKVYDPSGRLLYSNYKLLADLYIEKSDLSHGFLLFLFDDGSNVPVTEKIISGN